MITYSFIFIHDGDKCCDLLYNLIKNDMIEKDGK